MIENLSIRKANIDDVKTIVALLAEDELGKFRQDLSDEIYPKYYKAFEMIDQDANQHLVVIESGGEIVGTCHLTLIPSLTYSASIRMQIEAVRVSSKIRGNGAGEWMIKQAIKYGKSRGATLVQLTTNKQRSEAKRFYEKIGFKATHDGMKLFL